GAGGREQGAGSREQGAKDRNYSLFQKCLEQVNLFRNVFKELYTKGFMQSVAGLNLQLIAF
ncbi:hypothetical protein, partial [Nostoc sp. UHCC 0252]|uniref:hypothetical protein n=1 Tax=Nostoc sp. UHCC 0252 TaxID=3110241 RepID=UPI002B1F7C60